MFIAFAAFAPLANASVIIIAPDPLAAQGNFGTPGATANVGYTIQTSDNGTTFNVTETTTDPTALEFSNLYFDTIASTPGTGSNIGFEFGTTVANDDLFNPNTGTKYSIAGTGITATFTQTTTPITGTVTSTTANINIPNSFFLNVPDGFAASTPPGTLVSLHLSQTFSYSVVGGSANFPAPQELGDATIGSATTTPEPNFMLLVGTGILGVVAARKRFFRKSKQDLDM